MTDNADAIDCIFGFIESNCSTLRRSIRDRFTILNKKIEGELESGLEMCQESIKTAQARAVELASLNTKDQMDNQRRDMVALNNSFKRDVVKIVRHEIDQRTGNIVKELINVPELIGDGQKYGNF